MTQSASGPAQPEPLDGTQSSDAELALAARLATGDVDAFDEAFRLYLSPLCRYLARYVRSWDVAEDLAQTVFLQLWIRVRDQRLPPVRNIQAYLYNAGRCDALDYLKRRGVAERHAQVRPAVDTDTVGHIELADWDEETASRERIAALQRAVDALAPRQREVVLLRLKQLSYQEIAATLAISVKTVDGTLQRAFARLRSTLKQLIS